MIRPGGSIGARVNEPTRAIGDANDALSIEKARKTLVTALRDVAIESGPR